MYRKKEKIEDALCIHINLNYSSFLAVFSSTTLIESSIDYVFVSLAPVTLAEAMNTNKIKNNGKTTNEYFFSLFSHHKRSLKRDLCQ